MTRFENKTLTFRAWWGDAYGISSGYTRKAEPWDLHHLRIGQLNIRFGVEDHG